MYRYKYKILFFWNLLFFVSTAVTQINAYKIETVVIDAGHGGKDPGAGKYGVYEKDITLPVALLLGDYIEKEVPDVKVVYTRKTDIFIPLYKRAEIANNNDADLFISIHVNAIGKSNIMGTETYVLGLHRSEDNLRVAMQENAVLYYESDYSTRYEGFDPNKPESYIIFNLIQNQHLDNSLVLANLVEEQFSNRVNCVSRGVRQAGFLVLREVSMPSVLIETGFLTNKNDRNFLNSKKGQSSIASAIYHAFKKYKKIIEESSALPIKETSGIGSQNAIYKGDVYFSVQILSSEKKISLSSEKFKKMKDVQEHYIDNTYKYTIGKTQNSDEILNLHQKLKKLFKGCFVVGFLNGKRITYKEAKKIIEKKHE